MDEYLRWLYNNQVSHFTYTPVITLVGGALNTVPVYSTVSGHATRFGNRLLTDILFTGDGGAEGTGTGQMNISLLFPASATALDIRFDAGAALNNATRFQMVGRIQASASTIELFYWDTISTHATFTGAQQNNTTRNLNLRFIHEIQ